MPTPAPVTTHTLSQFGQMIGQDVQAVAALAMTVKNDTDTVRNGLSNLVADVAASKTTAGTDKLAFAAALNDLKTQAASADAALDSKLDSKIAAVVGAAPAALDTLEELGLRLSASGTGAEAIAAQVVDVSTKVTALEAAAIQASTDIGLLFDTYLDSSGRVGVTTGIVYKNPIVCLTSEAVFANEKTIIDANKTALNNKIFTVLDHPASIRYSFDALTDIKAIQTKSDILTKYVPHYSLPLPNGQRFYVDPTDTLQARLDAMSDADIATMIADYQIERVNAYTTDIDAIKALPEYQADLAVITAAEAKLAADIAAMRAAQAL